MPRRASACSRRPAPRRTRRPGAHAPGERLVPLGGRGVPRVALRPGSRRDASLHRHGPWPRRREGDAARRLRRALRPGGIPGPGVRLPGLRRERRAPETRRRRRRTARRLARRHHLRAQPAGRRREPRGPVGQLVVGRPRARPGERAARADRAGRGDRAGAPRRRMGHLQGIGSHGPAPPRAPWRVGPGAWRARNAPALRRVVRPAGRSPS